MKWTYYEDKTLYIYGKGDIRFTLFLGIGTIEGIEQIEEDWGTSITLCDKNKKEKGGAKTKKKAIKVENKYKSYLLPTFEKESDGVMWFKFTVKNLK